MSDIPTLIADHLSDTVKDDAVLGQMLRWLRNVAKGNVVSLGEVLPAPPADFCTFCDIHGHHRGNCPELAAAVVAAPLMIEEEPKERKFSF